MDILQEGLIRDQTWFIVNFGGGKKKKKHTSHKSRASSANSTLREPPIRRPSISETSEHKGAGVTSTNEAQASIIKNGKPKYSRPALDKDLPVNMTPIDPKTLLFFDAIREGSLQKVKAILRGKNMSLNTRDMNDPATPTALIVACELEQTEMVKMLLTLKKARSIDVNQEDKYGRRPIWIAAWKGNSEIADILLNSKGTECDVNFIDKETGTSPLYRAILSNTAEVAHLLIQAKADVNMRRMGKKNDMKAETPLIKAVQMDNIEIVKHLVNALCKIQGKTEDGFTALHFSVAYRRYEIAEFLLQNEIRIHEKSNFGITPMTVAIEHHNPAMVKLLIEYGYKMDKRYKWKETPLSQAINLHSEESAMTLIHQGCSIAKKRGQSYFYMAVDEKLMRLVKFMAAVFPQFLQEDWIKTKDWPVSIYHRPDIIKWLEQESEKVRTLRQLCRGKIFRLLGKYPTNKLKKLDLHENLAKYVSYTSHVKDEFFVKEVLNVRADCPIDCPAICSRKYCPPIEFSSESESDSSIDDDEVAKSHEDSHNHNHDHGDDGDKCCDYCK